MGADALLAIAAIITALLTGVAGLFKAYQSAADVADLKKTSREQGEKIEALEKENKALCAKISTLENEN